MLRLHRVIAIVLTVCGASSIQAAETPELAIRRLEDYFQSFNRCTLKYQEKHFLKNHSSNGEHVGTDDYRLMRDLPRWRLTGTTKNYIPPEGTQKGRKGSWVQEAGEWLHDGQTAYILELDDKASVSEGIISWKEATDQYLIRGTQSPGLNAFIDGWFGFNDFNLLPTIFRSGTTTTRIENGPSGELLVLEGNSPWGKQTVWMDPQRGYVPVKMIQRKGPDHWYKKDQPLGKFETTEYGGTFYKSHEVIATATKVEVVNGKHVVTAYRVTNTSEYQNGKTWVSTFIGTITDLNLSPKLTNADFSLASRNLDGAAVHMQDEPQIRYELKDGQPVKSIDENMVRAAEGHFFARNNQLSRLAFAALVVLAAALLVYVVSWLRQRRTVG